MKSNGLIDSIKFLTANPPGSKFFKSSIKGNNLNEKKNLTSFSEDFSNKTHSKLFKSLSNNNIKKIIENNKINEKNSKNKILNLNSKFSFTFKKSNFNHSNTFRLKRNSSSSSINNSILKKVKNYQLKKFIISLDKNKNNSINCHKNYYSLIYDSKNNNILNNNNNNNNSNNNKNNNNENNNKNNESNNNNNNNENNSYRNNFNNLTIQNNEEYNTDINHLKKMINIVEDLEKENFQKEYNLKLKIIEDLEKNIFNLKSFLRSYSVEKTKNDYEKFKLEKLLNNLLFVGQKYNEASNEIQKIFVEIVDMQNKIKSLKEETKNNIEKYKEEENNIKEINLLIGETNKEISLVRRVIQNTIPEINLLNKHNEELKSKINFRNNYQSNFLLNVNEMIEKVSSK